MVNCYKVFVKFNTVNWVNMMLNCKVSRYSTLNFNPPPPPQKKRCVCVSQSASTRNMLHVELINGTLYLYVETLPLTSKNKSAIEISTAQWGESRDRLRLARALYYVEQICHPQHTQTGSNSSTIAADSSNGVTNTRCCRYSCMRSWWWVEVPRETCRAVSIYK